MQETEISQKMNKLAREILILSRNTLLVNLRFLDMALSLLEPVPVKLSTLLTDGKHIFYNPKHVLSAYKVEKESVVREYLHIVLHCIFRHMYIADALDSTYWDLASDIAVENIISELGLKATASYKEMKQAAVLSELRANLKTVTAEKIYHYLREEAPDKYKAAKLRGLFYADDHQLWHMSFSEIQKKLELSSDDEEDKKIEEDGSCSATPHCSGDVEDTQSSESNGGGDENRQDFQSSRAEMAAVWKNISDKIQMDLETFSKLQGDKAGGLVQNLREVNREKYDYTSFLKKFAAMGEAMKINDDEFDYIFYTYGLKLYKKVPLVEPLEYKEVKRIKEFVIAIDTSGSVSGELVQAFIQKTYNILKSTESFFSKINLHIIQCDAEIQEHVKITSQDEFDRYINNMKLHGFGGTDFCPVFRFVDKLIKQKEFNNLKGLIYFTDGFGIFPSKKPDYETAFVFIDDEYNNPDIPPWAIKLVLQKNEI